MKTRICCLILLLMSAWSGYCQDQAAFGIRFSGFVRSDFFYDSRQTSNLREGHFLLYPENIYNDSEGNDINASGTFNILSICSRIKGNITAPDVLGAKTTGLLEGEFFGMSETDVNGFRLRHAYMKLTWPKVELLTGQYWNPMFSQDCYPSTISFNTGSPFQPFCRNPQLRLVYKPGALKFSLTAYTQRDFTSMGPDPKDPAKTVSSSLFMRNSGKPGMDVQIRYDLPGTEHFIAAGADYKVIKPELFTSSAFGKFTSSKEIPAFSIYAFLHLRTKPLTVKIYSMMGENTTDLTMIGGYACSEAGNGITGARQWENVRTASAWLDLQTTANRWRTGLFAGYTQNLGAARSMEIEYLYSRGFNIDHVYRVSPRLTYINGKLEVSAEFEYTVAGYGTPDHYCQVIHSKDVGNLRTLLVTVLNF